MARAIVVDDSKEQRDLLAAVLRADGHEVELAGNGREALNVLRASPCDLVLTDIFMPDCDGLELIRALRAKNARIRIVAMTSGAGMDGELFLRTAKLFGADLVLDKTLSPHDIVGAVGLLLQPAT